jgi:cysteine desulfurase
MTAIIYLDHNATTRPLPAVVRAVADCLTDDWANASSPHALGQQAKRRLAGARAQIADALGCEPAEIVFTSGATEANHLALAGALGAGERRRIVLSAIEHAGLRKLGRRLAEERRAEVDWIGVDRRGALDMEQARARIRAEVALVSVMAANNETGVLMPIAEVAALARAQGALLHVDATQWVGKLPFEFSRFGADLVSLSAHKFHGPKGVGALLVRHGLQWPAVLPGTQERGRRGGTENLPGIAGFAAAAQSVAGAETIARQAERVRRLRDALERGLRERLPGVEVFGAACERLPNTSFLRFGRLDADLVLARLERAGVVAAPGAACSSRGSEPSAVLLAMGVEPDEARAAVRLSLGAATTAAEVDDAVSRIHAALESQLQTRLQTQLQTQ